MKHVLIALTLIAAANPAQAGSFDLNRLGAKEIKGAETKTAPVQNLGWRHVGLRAEDGTGIKIDFNAVSIGNRIMATPVWINVSNSALKGGENVTAVLINYYDNSNQIESTQNIVLKYAGDGKFTAQADRIEVLQRSHNGSIYFCRQEIAVVVDGNWLVDPVTGVHNFKFNMSM